MGYAKLYSFQDSSLIEEDVVIRYIFLFFLSQADFNGFFEGSVGSLARRANVDVNDLVRAIDLFTEPDELSKSEIEEGRRIIYQGANRWWIVNYVEYRTKTDDGYRQYQWRKRKAKQRALEAGQEWDEDSWSRGDAIDQGTSRDCHGQSLHTDTDTDTDSSSVVGNDSKSKRVYADTRPPTAEDIFEYLVSRGYSPKGGALSTMCDEIIEHHKDAKWRTAAGKRIQNWKTHCTQWVKNRNIPKAVLVKFAEERRSEERLKKVREARRKKNG